MQQLLGEPPAQQDYFRQQPAALAQEGGELCSRAECDFSHCFIPHARHQARTDAIEESWRSLKKDPALWVDRADKSEAAHSGGLRELECRLQAFFVVLDQEGKEQLAHREDCTACLY